MSVTLTNMLDYFRTGSTLLNGLLSYWKLDDNSSTQNDSVGSNHLTVSGATYNVDAKIGKGVDYTSNTNYLRKAGGNLNLNTSAYTISLWLKLDNLPSTIARLYRIYDTVSADGVMTAYINSTGKIYVYWYNSVLGEFYTITNTSPISSTSVWYNIVIINQGAGLGPLVYVNNSTISNSPEPSTFSGTMRNEASLYIVIGNESSAGTTAPDGIIDEVGIWNRALSSTEVTELYNSGNGKSYPFA